MGGFGAMDTMNKSYQQNRELLKKSRLYDKVKHLKKFTFESTDRHYKTYKKATPEVLNAIRSKLRSQRYIRIAKSIFSFIAATSIVLFLIYRMGLI